jgi:RNA polymerase sigma-70 factor (ECF subfamily)
MDLLRRRYRGRKLTTPAAIDVSVEAPPDRQALNDELRQQVRQALAMLPSQQAEAFWLRHLENLSPSEIAEQMNIQPGNVRVLIHRAADQLRILLGESAVHRTNVGDLK